MRSKLFEELLLFTALVLSGLTQNCSAAHGHHHNDVLNRIMHKPTASSGSSLNSTSPLAELLGKYSPNAPVLADIC